MHNTFVEEGQARYIKELYDRIYSLTAELAKYKGAIEVTAIIQKDAFHDINCLSFIELPLEFGRDGQFVNVWIKETEYFKSAEEK